MKVTVHSWGGLVAADRWVEVDGRRVTVTEGKQHRERTLEPGHALALAGLAGRVARLSPDVVGPAPESVDAGYTDLEITDGDLVRQFRLPAGADAPDAVWDLLAAVEEAGEPGPVTKGGPGTSR